MSCQKTFEVRIKRFLYNASTGDMRQFRVIDKWQDRTFLQYRDVIYSYKLQSEEYGADVSCSVHRYGIFQQGRTFRPLGGIK